MAETDWTLLTGSLGSASLDRGVTTGIARPNGGGSFVHGFASLDTTEGVSGYFCNLVNFAPMAKGGSVRGAMKRGISGGLLNFAPFIFIGLQSADANAVGYMLGLGDAEASRITLRKGALSASLPDQVVTIPPTLGVLSVSESTIANDEWVHLRLDMVVNLNGDVILNVYQNDLDANTVAAPVWSAITGMSAFVDDSLGVNSGSAPLTSGRVGWGFYKKDVTRRGFFDHIEVTRQT